MTSGMNKYTLTCGGVKCKCGELISDCGGKCFNDCHSDLCEDGGSDLCLCECQKDEQAFKKKHKECGTAACGVVLDKVVKRVARFEKSRDELNKAKRRRIETKKQYDEARQEYDDACSEFNNMVRDYNASFKKLDEIVVYNNIYEVNGVDDNVDNDGSDDGDDDGSDDGDDGSDDEGL